MWSVLEGLTLPGSSVVVLQLPFTYTSADGHVVALSVSAGDGSGDGVGAGGGGGAERGAHGGENVYVGELLRGSLVFVPA